MPMLGKKVLGISVTFLIFVFSNVSTWAESNPTFSEMLGSIAQTVDEAGQLEGKLPLGGVNQRYITNRLQALVVSGLEIYPSKAGVIIKLALQAPFNVRKSVTERVGRDFPGFRYLLTSPPARKTSSEEKIVPTAAGNEVDTRVGKKIAENDGTFRVTELVFGISAHDIGAFGRHKESGENINVELRFTPLDWSIWRVIYEPQPHIGLHINSDNNTNQLYIGAGWVFDLTSEVYLTGTLGISLHDGKTSTTSLDRKELGSNLLFRESLEIGYKLSEIHAFSIYLDHISNAGIAENNEGLDTSGLRYSYRL